MKKIVIFMLAVLLLVSLFLLLSCEKEEKDRQNSNSNSAHSSYTDSSSEKDTNKEYLPSFEINDLRYSYGDDSVDMHSSFSFTFSVSNLDEEYISDSKIIIYKDGEVFSSLNYQKNDGNVDIQERYLDTDAKYTLKFLSTLTVNGKTEENTVLYERDISFPEPYIAVDFSELGNKRGVPFFMLNTQGTLPQELTAKITVSKGGMSKVFNLEKTYFENPYTVMGDKALDIGNYTVEIVTTATNNNATQVYTHIKKDFSISYDPVECILSGVEQEKDTATVTVSALNEFGKLKYYNVIAQDENGSVYTSENFTAEESVFSLSRLLPNTTYTVKVNVVTYSDGAYERSIGEFTTPDFDISPYVSVENLTLDARTLSLNYLLDENNGCKITTYGIYLYNGQESVCILAGDTVPTETKNVEYGFLRSGTKYNLGIFCNYTYGQNEVKDFCLYTQEIVAPEHNLLPTLTLVNKDINGNYLYFEGSAGTADEATYVVEFYKNNVLVKSNSYSSLPSSVYTGIIEENDVYTVRVYADLFYYNILHRIDRFLVAEEEITPSKTEIEEYSSEIGDILIDGETVYFDYIAIATQYASDYYLYLLNSKGEVVRSSVFTSFYTPEVYEENLNYVTDKSQLYMTKSIEELTYSDTYTIQFVQRINYFGSDKYIITAEKSFEYKVEEEKPKTVVNTYEITSNTLTLDYTLSEKYFSDNCNVTLYAVDSRNMIVTGLYCLDSFSPYNLTRQTVFEHLDPESDYRIFAEYYFQRNNVMQRKVECIFEFTTLPSYSLPYVTVKDVSLPPYSALGNLTYTVHGDSNILSAISNLTLTLYGHTNKIEIQETDMKVGSDLYTALRYPLNNTISYERLYTIVFTADFTLNGKEYENYELLRYEHSAFRLDSTGTFEYYIADNTIAVITGYKSNLIYCAIPKELDGYPVMEIGAGAFEGNTTIETIVIGENILDISDSAFKGCTNLYHIKFNKNLLAIGDNAFENCSSLKFLDLSHTQCNIGKGAFKNCDGIEKVILGETSFIEEYAFYGCNNLNTVIANSVEMIEEYTFYGCEGLISAEFNSVSCVEDYSFYSCTNLENAYFNKNLYSIGNYSFYNCNTLSTIDVSNKLRSIGEYAFYGCYFDYLHITDSIESIGKSAFENACINYLTLPSTLKTVGENAFNTSSPIENFVYDGSLLDWCNITFENKLSNPASNAENWYYNYDCSVVNANNSSYKFIIPLGVTKIGNYQFANLDMMSVYIPSTVTSIGEGAFEDCISLTKLYFDSSVTEVSSNAFLNCPIANFTYNGTVENWCFIKFENYQSNPVSSNTTVKFDNYYSESTLPNICIPASVKEIGAYQFRGFRFDTVYIEDGITKINKSAFEKATVNYLRLTNTIQVLDMYSLLLSSANIYYDGNISKWNEIEFNGYGANPQYLSGINLYIKNSAGYSVLFLTKNAQ